MASDGTGTIYIPLAEFWEFVSKFSPRFDGESVYGVPRVVGDDLVIDYAFSSECHPSSWMRKPDAVRQWDEQKRKEETPP
jgi:hypothetical protein